MMSTHHHEQDSNSQLREKGTDCTEIATALIGHKYSYHMMSTHHHEQDSNSQLRWRKALIVQV